MKLSFYFIIELSRWAIIISSWSLQWRSIMATIYSSLVTTNQEQTTHGPATAVCSLITVDRKWVVWETCRMHIVYTIQCSTSADIIQTCPRLLTRLQKLQTIVRQLLLSATRTVCAFIIDIVSWIRLIRTLQLLLYCLQIRIMCYIAATGI